MWKGRMKGRQSQQDSVGKRQSWKGMGVDIKGVTTNMRGTKKAEKTARTQVQNGV